MNSHFKCIAPDCRINSAIRIESWWIYEQRKIIAVQQGTIFVVTAIAKQADNRNRVSENQN